MSASGSGGGMVMRGTESVLCLAASSLPSSSGVSLAAERPLLSISLWNKQAKDLLSRVNAMSLFLRLKLTWLSMDEPHLGAYPRSSRVESSSYLSSCHCQVHSILRNSLYKTMFAAESISTCRIRHGQGLHQKRTCCCAWV